MEKTLVLIKPDAVQRGLVGRIVSRIEDKGLRIVGMKFLLVSDERARNLYAFHEGKSFFQSLVQFIASSPLVAMVVEGENAITQVRTMMGATDPQDAHPGTVRGDYGQFIQYNLIHGSDSAESAIREIKVFFDEQELVPYERSVEEWIYPS